MKTMRKSLMKRTELQHTYFKIKSSENLKLFKLQRNFCSRLYTKEKERNILMILIYINKIIDNRLFWKTVIGLFFQIKVSISQKFL